MERAVRKLLRSIWCATFLATAAPLVAQQTVVDGDRFRLDLTGYFGTLAAGQDLGYDAPSIDRRTVFIDDVVRLKWLANIGDRVRIEVHNRLQSQLTSSSSAAGNNVLGIGVSAVPGRSVDLSSTITSTDRTRLVHDIDRLTIRILTDAVDMTVGRQGISWGISNVFPVADLWAQFSPYELDTEEKPGVDAVRGLLYPADGWEIDAVAAARGSGRDFSVGVRATVELPWADVYIAGGKFWRRAMGLAGISVVLDSWVLRGELVVPWNLDTEEVERTRATIGADYVAADLFLSVEYHYNGLGSSDLNGYLAGLSSTEFQRGETYYLGRHYLGGIVSYLVNDRISLAANTIANLQDRSGSVTPTLSYDFGGRWKANIGALLTYGSTPTFAPLPAINSEFGTYGRLAFLQLSAYF